jgi:hypothetical protein
LRNGEDAAPPGSGVFDSQEVESREEGLPVTPAGEGDRRDDWWADIERELLGCFDTDGVASIDTVARRLGIPEAAAISLVALLACEGKVHIRLVERPRGAGMPLPRY